MKLILNFLLIVVFGSMRLAAQVDTASLMKEVDSKLKQGVVVSTILSDKNYLSLHPETGFREMIKQHAAAGILTITTSDEPGRAIKVTGTVKNSSGQPIADALVYVYQTDNRGWYATDFKHVIGMEGDRRHAQLFGYVKTDANGHFELHTIKPQGYPGSELPAHIHIEISASGYNGTINELLFDDDPRLQGDVRTHAIQERAVIGKPQPGTAPFEQEFNYELSI